MDLLNKPIKSFSFEDIVRFCTQTNKEREGYQLDYKVDLTSGSLSKHFAAFSNTKGGIIIIGVEEDKTTGFPIKWEGVANNAAILERIHQMATNVSPVPLFEVAMTDSVNDKVFVLVRILEGDNPPYYVQNDPIVYTRTGNISNPLAPASPDLLELIFHKKEKAEKHRLIELKYAQEIYVAAYKRANKQIANVANKIDEDKKRLIEKTSILTLSIQPHYSLHPIASPLELKNNVITIRDYDKKVRLDQPDLNPELIPNGIMSFEYNPPNTVIENEQIHSCGTIYFKKDILNLNKEKTFDIYLSHIALYLFNYLKVASNMYQIFSYQGGIIINISLEDCDGIPINSLRLRNSFPSFSVHNGLLQSYSWSHKTDTSTLVNESGFSNILTQLIKEIHWSFNYDEISDNIIRSFFKETKNYDLV